jgi:hypothetical protein
MKIFTRIFLLLVLFLLPIAGFAQDMHMAGMGNEPELGASAAFDAHGRLWLVTARNGHVLLRHSDDFGKTLSTPVAVNQVPEKIYDEGENRPKIALGPQGQIYISWSEPLAKPYTGYVRFARSTDGGKHFSTPITVNHDLAPITHRFDALAVAGNGDVVIAWIDGRGEVAAKAAGKPYLGKALWYSLSSNGGKTFVPERKLMDHSCECCRIALAREPDGAIATFFRGVFGDNIRDHAFALLRTGGTFDSPRRVTFSNWQVAACPHQGPGLVIGADGVRHGVWYEASHGPAIWYGQLDPGHPPQHKLRIGGPGASHADVAVDGRTVWVAWNQVNAEGYALMARISHDDGDHFDPPRTLATSTAAVYSPQLLVHAGRAYAAWNTASDFRLIKIPNATEATP